MTQETQAHWISCRPPPPPGATPRSAAPWFHGAGTETDTPQAAAGTVVAVAWRRGDHSLLLDRFLGFVRGYRDTNAWSADTPRLSPAHKHLLDGCLADPVSWIYQTLEVICQNPGLKDPP